MLSVGFAVGDRPIESELRVRLLRCRRSDCNETRLAPPESSAPRTLSESQQHGRVGVRAHSVRRAPMSSNDTSITTTETRMIVSTNPLDVKAISLDGDCTTEIDVSSSLADGWHILALSSPERAPSERTSLSAGCAFKPLQASEADTLAQATDADTASTTPSPAGRRLLQGLCGLSKDVRPSGFVIVPRSFETRRPPSSCSPVASWRRGAPGTRVKQRL